MAALVKMFAIQSPVKMAVYAMIHGMIILVAAKDSMVDQIAYCMAVLLLNRVDLGASVLMLTMGLLNVS